MHDERNLVEQAKKGDDQALARLYEENFERVYRYIAIRVGNAADAEDLTAQVFMKMLESINSFKWRGVPFIAWLFRIARNLTIDHLRKRARQGQYTSEPVSHLDPAMMAEKRMAVEQMLIAMDKLTQAQSEVLTLRFGAGLSTAETAKVLGKREGAVKAMQHSALRALKRRLSEWGHDE